MIKLGLLSYFLYLISIVWILLFPAINISSGELKPRGLYVDENALLINNLETSAWLKAVEVSRNETSGVLDLCNEIKAFVTSCSAIMSNETPRRLIHTIVFDSPRKEKSPEASLVCVSFLTSDQSRVYAFTRHMVRTLIKVKWLSKQVYVLLIPVDPQQLDSTASSSSINYYQVLRYSNALDRWLKLRFDDALGAEDISSEQINDNFESLIREAYILDLTASDGADWVWDSIKLHNIGTNGQLPNMDMVSAPLSLLPFLQPAYCFDPSGKGTSRSMPTGFSMQGAIFTLLQLLPSGYRSRLASLMTYAYESMTGPDGLHTHFISRNIDAITLRPISSSLSNIQRSKRGRVKTSGNTERFDRRVHSHASRLNNIGEEDLIATLLTLLRMTSGLHEELHHSHSFYLIMGTRYFVGLGEYAYSLVLSLVPLIAVVLCALSRASPGVGDETEAERALFHSSPTRAISTLAYSDSVPSDVEEEDKRVEVEVTSTMTHIGNAISAVMAAVSPLVFVFFFLLPRYPDLSPSHLTKAIWTGYLLGCMCTIIHCSWSKVGCDNAVAYSERAYITVVSLLLIMVICVTGSMTYSLAMTLSLFLVPLFSAAAAYVMLVSLPSSLSQPSHLVSSNFSTAVSAIVIVACVIATSPAAVLSIIDQAPRAVSCVAELLTDPDILLRLSQSTTCDDISRGSGGVAGSLVVATLAIDWVEVGSFTLVAFVVTACGVVSQAALRAFLLQLRLLSSCSRPS